LDRVNISEVFLKEKHWLKRFCSSVFLEPTLQSIKKAVDNGELDRLLEEQLSYGSHLRKYL